MSITVADELHMVPAVAERLKVSKKCIWSWLYSGRLGKVKLGRSVRIPESEVQRIIAEGFVPASK